MTQTQLAFLASVSYSPNTSTTSTATTMPAALINIAISSNIPTPATAVAAPKTMGDQEDR